MDRAAAAAVSGVSRRGSYPPARFIALPLALWSIVLWRWPGLAAAALHSPLLISRHPGRVVVTSSIASSHQHCRRRRKPRGRGCMSIGRAASRRAFALRSYQRGDRLLVAPADGNAPSLMTLLTLAAKGPLWRAGCRYRPPPRNGGRECRQNRRRPWRVIAYRLAALCVRGMFTTPITSRDARSRSAAQCAHLRWRRRSSRGDGLRSSRFAPRARPRSRELRGGGDVHVAVTGLPACGAGDFAVLRAVNGRAAKGNRVALVTMIAAAAVGCADVGLFMRARRRLGCRGRRALQPLGRAT